MQFVYVSDLVGVCLGALTKHTAPGRAFNVADEKALTQVDVVNELARTMGKQAQIVRVPREILVRQAGTRSRRLTISGSIWIWLRSRWRWGREAGAACQSDAVCDRTQGNLQVVLEALAK